MKSLAVLIAFASALLLSGCASPSIRRVPAESLQGRSVTGRDGREKIPDLTGADAKVFQAHIGRVVSVRGRLGQDKEAMLYGAGPKGFAFCIIPDVPPQGYTWQAPWTQLEGRQVRVTGKLCFRSCGPTNTNPLVQTLADYYYMVLQETHVEPIKPK